MDGRHVLDESEFLKFFHNLLIREDLEQIFDQVNKQSHNALLLIQQSDQVTEKYKGLAITPKELQKFMIEEQACSLWILALDISS